MLGADVANTSVLPNDVLCQVWLILAQRFWRKKSKINKLYQSLNITTKHKINDQENISGFLQELIKYFNENT